MLLNTFLKSVLIVLISSNWGHACDGFLPSLQQAYLDKTPFVPPCQVQDAAQARRIQAAFVEALKPHLGAVRGYKAGLTSPQAQTRFGVDQPQWGVLLDGMLHQRQIRLSFGFATAPLIELDLVAVVGDPTALMQARDDVALLAAIEAWRPFVEVPDDLYAPGTAMNGPAVVAINVGARAGVLGDPVQLDPGQAGLSQLADLQAQWHNWQGEAMGKPVPAKNLMGNPIHALRWLVQALAADGVVLKQGDLLSLGSFGPPQSLKPGTFLKVRYAFPNRKPVEVQVKIGF